MKTKTIEITNPKDYREGDMFTGTVRNYKAPDGATSVTTITGPLRKSESWGLGGRLYVQSNLPWVDLDVWEDVKVTREVEVEPTTQEALEALPVGTVVLFTSPGFDEEDALPWMKVRDEGTEEVGWVDATDLNIWQPLPWINTYTLRVIYQPKEEL